MIDVLEMIGLLFGPVAVAVAAAFTAGFMVIRTLNAILGALKRQA